MMNYKGFQTSVHGKVFSGQDQNEKKHNVKGFNKINVINLIKCPLLYNYDILTILMLK